MAAQPVDPTPYLNKWVSQKVSYLTRDLLLYAVGIGSSNRRYTYEYDDDFEAFPTYPLVLGFKGTDQDVVDFPSETMQNGPRTPSLPGVRVGLDGERFIERIRPLPTDGGEFTLKSRLVGVHKRGSGASLETEAVIVGEDGLEYYRIITGTFLVGAKGFTDAGVTHSQSIKPPSQSPDKVVELDVPEHQAQLYRLSGDYNPLHIDPDFATSAGFPKPILHGLCSLGMSCRAVLDAYCDGAADRFKAIRVRFAAPVLPGNALRIEMWAMGDRIVFQTKSNGKTVINNAYVDLTPASRL
eukprot:m.194884 g.194884  ORF g.194884 m.194884 type:complete len:297 (-) comp19316_c0_seq1:147-1037(-)